jgi:tetratricopeptide (TPR) repeat protein
MNFRLVTVCIIFLILVPVMVTAAETDADLQSAGALYDKSVDLANAGNYTESLKLSDQALAFNVSSLLPVIQANRAGILTVLGRYDEAIIAADAALAVEGNLTTAHSIAWYNKGDALRHLGRIDEAKLAFAHAQDLDPALVPPSGMTTSVATVPTTAKSSLPWSLAAGALSLVFIIGGIFSRNR